MIEELAGLLREPDRAQPDDPGLNRRLRDISRELARVERNTAIRLRDEGRINDDVLRQIERDLDLEEARLQGREAA
jgi:CPA1 family monovalent cation:H+ antiporter